MYRANVRWIACIIESLITDTSHISTFRLNTEYNIKNLLYVTKTFPVLFGVLLWGSDQIYSYISYKNKISKETSLKIRTLFLVYSISIKWGSVLFIHISSIVFQICEKALFYKDTLWIKTMSIIHRMPLLRVFDCIYPIIFLLCCETLNIFLSQWFVSSILVFKAWCVQYDSTPSKRADMKPQGQHFTYTLELVNTLIYIHFITVKNDRNPCSYWK